ncbi:MAG: hypothetical protein R3B13_34180 [Polyangiaceae bacterium]
MLTPFRRTAGLVVALVLGAVTACSGDEDGSSSSCSDCPVKGTQAVLDFAADLSDPSHFFDVPYPNDLRRDDQGHPELSGFPNPNDLGLLKGFVNVAVQAKGFSTLSVAQLRFTAPLAPLSKGDVIAAEPSSPILLIEVDPDSPDRGKLLPVVAETLAEDLYTPSNMLAVSPRPGFVLRANTTYAVVVRTSLLDADGRPLVQSPVLRRLSRDAPLGDAEAAGATVHALVWEALDDLGVPRGDVAATTLFTTGDVVQETAEIAQGLEQKYQLSINGMSHLDDAEIPDVCIIQGEIEYPQFQKGTPPYNTEGLFEFGSDGLPVEQRKEVAPIKLVIPKTEMPPNGYPLVLNIHGSGGYSIAMLRPVGDDGKPGAPIGPALPYAFRGFATAGSAMPVNPERLPGASETAYLNTANFVALRDTFRQGLIEMRLFLSALEKLEIGPAMLANCAGPTLPAGAMAFKFDLSKLVLTGQSMGGMYTNMLSAIEPRIKAVVPTGAGGHWTHFIFLTPLNNGLFPGALNLALGTTGTLSHVHPVVSLAAAALEPADPIVYVPRISRRPLEGHPVRPIYEPCAPDDAYFAQETYDAIALAYGHPQAGEAQWASMQSALALAGLEGLRTLPLSDNLKSEDGRAYTGAVLQFAPKALPGEAKADGHAIYSHRDDVKYQYGCFAASFLAGKAEIPPPQNDWKASCN